MLSDKSRRRIVDASLLRAIVEQFVERPSHPLGDVTQFERLALGLMDIVDAETVARLARPLGFHPETPASIFARLREKGGACAALALQFDPAAPRAELLAVAERGEAELARAVAARADLDRDVAAALAWRGDQETLRTLASNRAAHLDAAARRALVQAGREDLVLARILLDRDDLEIDAEPLFLAATRLERTGIVLDACRKTLAAGLNERRAVEPAFAAAFEAAALRRDRGAMADLLAQAFDCRKERARALIADLHGDALALALAALGFAPEAATRVFLCADASISHDTDRVRALVALLRAAPQRAAARIVAAIVGAARSEPARQGWRPEPLAGPGWRRALRAGPETLRKHDRSA
jgi:uncharacterized protein (DUF2336 family)